MDLRRLLLSGSLAGALIALLSRLPLIGLVNLLFWGWVWAGSLFAAWHYNYLGGGQSGEERNITLREGRLVGGFAGLVGAAVGGVIFYFYLQFIGLDELVAFAASLLGISSEELLASLPQNSDPFLSMALINAAVNACIYPFIGFTGGAIGARLFGRAGMPTPPTRDNQDPPA
jgi:hypothetical protein